MNKRFLVLSLIMAAASSAQTLTVNTTLDTIDPSDGVLSLREAITLSNLQVGADSITFAVGADAERIRWGIETARAARAAGGLQPGMAFGAYVNVVVHDDPEVGRRLGEGGVSLFARFSAMHGSALGPTTAEEKRVMEGIHDAYDMTRHSRAGSPQAGVITSEFASEFGIFGDSRYCLERLQGLVALGLDRLVVVGSSAGAEPNEAARAEQRFVEEVLPGLR